jgi:hypothetical protein
MNHMTFPLYKSGKSYLNEWFLVKIYVGKLLNQILFGLRNNLFN